MNVYKNVSRKPLKLDFKGFFVVQNFGELVSILYRLSASSAQYARQHIFWSYERSNSLPNLIAIGVSVGILSGIWASGSMSLGLITYAGFFAWSSYFSAGGGKKGMMNSLPTNLSGVVWGYLMVQMSALFAILFGDTLGLGIAVAIGACGMCLQSRWKVLGFIPGTFIGSSTYFATGYQFVGSISGLILGTIFGYLSEKGVSLLIKRP